MPLPKSKTQPPVTLATKASPKLKKSKPSKTKPVAVSESTGPSLAPTFILPLTLASHAPLQVALAKIAVEDKIPIFVPSNGHLVLSTHFEDIIQRHLNGDKLGSTGHLGNLIMDAILSTAGFTAPEDVAETIVVAQPSVKRAPLLESLVNVPSHIKDAMTAWDEPSIAELNTCTIAESPVFFRTMYPDHYDAILTFKSFHDRGCEICTWAGKHGPRTLQRGMLRDDYLEILRLSHLASNALLGPEGVARITEAVIKRYRGSYFSTTLKKTLVKQAAATPMD